MKFNVLPLGPLLVSVMLVSSCSKDAEQEPQLQATVSSTATANANGQPNLTPEQQRMIDEENAALRTMADMAARSESAAAQNVAEDPYTSTPYTSDIPMSEFGQLLKRHRAACSSGDSQAFLSLFVKSVQYGFSKMEPGQFDSYMNTFCQDPVITKFENELAGGKLIITSTGKMDQGVEVSVLCVAPAKGPCKSGTDLAIEDNLLKFAEW